MICVWEIELWTWSKWGSLSRSELTSEESCWGKNVPSWWIPSTELNVSKVNVPTLVKRMIIEIQYKRHDRLFSLIDLSDLSHRLIERIIDIFKSRPFTVQLIQPFAAIRHSYSFCLTSLDMMTWSEHDKLYSRWLSNKKYWSKKRWNDKTIDTLPSLNFPARPFLASL